MKIHYLLAGNYARGGIRVQIEHANYLHERGHDVAIFSPYTRPEWIDVVATWNQISIPDGKTLGSTALPPADITVFSYYEQAFALYQHPQELQTTPVYLAQGDELLFGDPETAESPENKGDILAAQTSLKIPYPIITVSNPAREFIESKGGKNVRVIPNGINPELFYPRETKPNQPLKILSVGAETPSSKGIEHIYAALIKLQSDPEAPPFTFVRASPQENALGKLPIPVEFHKSPSAEELAHLYATADIFVGASSVESFYLLPLEAMASGTAVVCSQLPAICDYAKPQRDFLPFPPGDIAALYSQIKLALQSSTTRQMLVQNGLTVAGKMTWQEIIIRLEQEFGAILEQKENWKKRLLKHRKAGKIQFSIKKRPSKN